MNDELYDAIDGTWAPASIRRSDGWVYREGKGGGSRVSATTAETIGAVPDIGKAEHVMDAARQMRLFMLRPGEDPLDHALEARGYRVKDPVHVYGCPIAQLCDHPLPRVTMLPVWEPLAIMIDIWAEAGVGPERLAVMHRVAGPKTAFLGRRKDKPAGVAFAAIHDSTVLVHAIEILPNHRRQGMAGWAMRAAALWGRAQGAHTIAVLCTRDNTGANALYTSLAMTVVGHYHYRVQDQGTL